MRHNELFAWVMLVSTIFSFPQRSFNIKLETSVIKVYFVIILVGAAGFL